MSLHDWSPQQAKALDAVAEWIRSGEQQVFRLFGYAGTGKTTLARHLAEACRAPQFAAFTGKAASVLRTKGCGNATTLHSLMYNVTKRDRVALNALELKLAGMTPDHPDYAETRWERDEELKRVKMPWFFPNPDSVLQYADLIIVDEVSMVDERIGKDLESFGKKILVLGDPAQLPPVKGGGYFTDRTPDILLTEVHRHATDNPVYRWATLARSGEAIPYGDEGAAKKYRRDSVDPSWYATHAGQILCGKNETRRMLNAEVRKHLGRTSIYPVYKDTLVILMNDHKLGVLNGTLCRAQCDAEAEDGKVWLNIAYERQILRDLCVDPCIFEGKECFHERSRLQMDYGYCLTVHKAQGSQWENVTLYDDGFMKRDPSVRRRWLYTAITRAEKTLTIVTS